MRNLTRRHLAFGVTASLLIATNWIVFLWAVDNGQAVEAALGYFLMPLISVGLGVGLLGERLRPLQGWALGLAGIGIVWTFVVIGSVPWVALVIGSSFAVYGWARKQGSFQAVGGLTFETMILAPVLLGVLVWRGSGVVAVTGDGDLTTLVFLAATGVVTVVPLLLFAAATKSVSLTSIGLLQYINPTLQFLVGWQIFGESVSNGRLLGFAWIWAALGLVVVDQFRSKRPVDGGVPRSDEGLVGLGERLATEEPPVGR
jgi:chloramphenicol-sensitive protein RarD